jgi:pSer/pThr/pTyr-binding forkhead associated (FHA) protein
MAERKEVCLKALTPEAMQAIGGPTLVLHVFPYRIGRESRGGSVTRALLAGGDRRREGTGTPNNDLYILEKNREVYISREHLAIEEDNSGFYLVDRMSALGTWVEGKLVGGDRRGGRVPLHSGDVIIIGSAHGGFIFKFLVNGE